MTAWRDPLVSLSYNEVAYARSGPYMRSGMSQRKVPPSKSSHGRYLAAIVLGTALTALGSSAARADASIPESRAITDISRYCTACWRNARLDPGLWEDCTQEVLCRLLDRLAPEEWTQVLSSDGEERREFLRAIDAVKKRTQRSRKAISHMVENLPDPNDGDRRQLAEERATVQQAAEQLLSDRQKSILGLSLDGWSVHDISKELHSSPARISDEKYKAIRKLQKHFSPA